MTAASPNFEVDEPIINDAYEEPTKFWLIKKGERPALVEGRRPAAYYWRPARLEPGVSPTGNYVKLELVNRIRAERKRWRADGYPGATSVTRELLDYWERPERDRKIIFAQREAAETLIFLKEAPMQYKQGLAIPRDDPNATEGPDAYHGFERLCVKMATGSGKTTVMGLVAAWSILNSLADPKNKLYSDTILALCPNVTIRERLAELDPKRGNASIYRIRDIVHPSRMLDLARGTVIVTNWHTLQPHAGNEVGGVSAAVVNKGDESDKAVVNRVLGPSALGKKNILIFNDEAHHAYRIPPDAPPDQETLDDDGDELEEEERKEATVWVEGIDKVNHERGVNFALDLSATPLIRNGPLAGRLFPWIISEFGLVDAIECGLVKIPQLPVATPSGREVPEYFNIWDWIVKEKLTAGERGGKRGAVKPEAIVAHAKLPIKILADDWRKTFAQWAGEAAKGQRADVPPVFIIVCRDTKLAAALFDAVAKPVAGNVIAPEFVNTDLEENTIRVDSKVVQDMEAGSKSTEARRLRFILDTVGRTKWPGDRVPEEWKMLADELALDPRTPPGKNVRCIVSVGMLTEGWDATTVTHIVGIRPFQSQLLCEQVVGRALRRAQWNDLKVEEVARIFGVPFEVVPFKAARPKAGGESLQSTHVVSRTDREELAIRFPRVARYVPIVKGRIVADWSRVPTLFLDPMETPNEVVVQGLSIDDKGQLTRAGVGKQARLGLDAVRAVARLQQLEFRLASRLTENLVTNLKLPPAQVFPDVLHITRKYIQTKVIPKGSYQRVDLAFYDPWFDRAFEDLSQSLGSADGAGEIGELPVFELDRPEGSTFDVDFWTSRKCFESTRSHLNYTVADTGRWEQAAAYHLEQHANVLAYAKNFDMGFTIPYTWKGDRHDYTPDYLVRMSHAGVEVGTLILEVKGFMDERAMLCAMAAKRWIAAINRDGRYGRWEYAICSDPANVESILNISARDLASVSATAGGGVGSLASTGHESPA